MAKTLKRNEMEEEEEPVAMEDDKDEDVAEAVCRVAGEHSPKVQEEGDGMRK